jgi:hypothetical protein
MNPELKSITSVGIVDIGLDRRFSRDDNHAEDWRRRAISQWTEGFGAWTPDVVRGCETIDSRQDVPDSEWLLSLAQQEVMDLESAISNRIRSQTLR